MKPIQLEYGLQPSRVERHIRTLKLAAVFTGIVCVTIATFDRYRAIRRELALRYEERRLTIANEPQIMFPSLAVQFNSKGQVMLPGGAVARMAELDLSNTYDKARLNQDFKSLMRDLQARKIGFNVTGSDADGVPVVHLWALSRNDRIDCGNSGPLERRTAAWLLWRNMNYALIDRDHFPCRGVQAERCEEHTKIHYGW